VIQLSGVHCISKSSAQEVSGCPERRRTRIRVEVRKRNALKKRVVDKENKIKNQNFILEKVNLSLHFTLVNNTV
jgi:hypothetical protein